MTSSPNRLLAAVFGAVYLLVGLAGFVVTSGVGFAATEGRNLLLFEVNPLHNIVHLGIGAALLLASRSVRAARGTNVAIGAVYLLVGVVGLFLVDTGANIIALNGADNVLHLASALLLLGVGLAADREDAGRAVTA
ncbi:DUF4383 domain-containing protein [Cellulosimicrobium cellulans]|jgi:hypothetical protein|uniref:DUF4383 domain-containing protein n=1 Tax=Cellulosimicrobium TaxID=157920 RepID=UPI0008849F2E|nr:DUF4383 domain-containing protein [Sphaerisporangium cinnabarinum]MCR1982189.1 DUF4383 domain-containing protein [Cellulosimicrobium cellulans]PTU55355.1 DUF4383 domain-containing protein [Sphaerisporangium cinnabarinum]SDF82696.1 protein of unknown function [Cellulosimicrobium cellulans]